MSNSEALPESDPIIKRMRSARRRSFFIGGGVAAAVVAAIVLIVVFHAPREKLDADTTPVTAKEARPEPSGGDPGASNAKPGDSDAAATAGDAAQEPGDKNATPTVVFDDKETRDETRYLYHRLQKPMTLEALATELYGAPTRMALLVTANSGIKNENEFVPAGVELRVPRFTEYAVKPGDTLGDIAARELGAEKEFSRILDANREQLTSPETLAAGMRLKIPILKPAP